MNNFMPSTQYSDIKGNISMDEEDYKGLHKLVELSGIDSDKNFPIAFDLHIDSLGTYSNKKIMTSLVIYTVEDNPSYQTTKDFVDNNDPIPVKSVGIEISLDDFFKHFKRINIVASGIDGVIGKNYKII